MTKLLPSISSERHLKLSYIKLIYVLPSYLDGTNFLTALKLLENEHLYMYLTQNYMNLPIYKYY
jgi:hypothetical protein